MAQPRALVLFTGTGSVDRSLEKFGFKVDSLDIDKKCKATWTTDILTWESWRDITPGTYTFIWRRLPALSIVSPERLPKSLGISRWQIVSSPKVLKSTIICSRRAGFSKTPQLDISRLAASWPICRSRQYVTACIPTEYATDTGNPPVCGGSFPHSLLGPCAHGRNHASFREKPGNIHVAPKDSLTVALETRDSASTTYIRCQWHLRTTLPRQRQNLSDLRPDFPANLPLFLRPLLKPLQMSSQISPYPFWDEIPAQPSSISRER